MNEVQMKEMQKRIAMAMALSEVMTKEAEPPKPTFGEFAKTYLAEKQASPEHRESTKRATEYQFRRNLIPAFGEIPLDKFGNADWNAWVKLMRADQGRIKQVTRFFNARKTTMELLHAAEERGLIDRVPRLAQPDQRKKVGRVLSDKEVWWILRNTTYKIFRLFFYTMFKQGFRPREILKWERSMLKPAANGTLWLDIPASITKTKRARRAPVNQTVAKHIVRMLKENPNSRFVFQNRIHPDSPQLSYHGAWRTAVEKAMAQHPEMKPCVPYDFRRTKITREVIKGSPAVFLGKLLDTSVAMIEGTYTKDDAKTLEALVE